MQAGICPNCGAPIASYDKNCRVCGYLFDGRPSGGQTPPIKIPPLVVAGLLVILVLFSAVFGTWWFTIGPGHPTPTSTTSNTFCLATDLPETGTLAAQGLGIRHGVEVALQQSTLFTATYKGYHLTKSFKDDVLNGGDPNPDHGAKNVTDLFQDTSCPNPIAVIGPYNSAVAQSEIPAAAKNHLLLLSPSNTAPCLTKESYSIPSCVYKQIHSQDSWKKTYARLPGTDIDRGYLSANFLVNSASSVDSLQRGLGAQKIEVVGSEDIAGTQAAQVLIEALGHKGMTPVGIDCIKSTDDYKQDPSCSQLNAALNRSTQAFSMDNTATNNIAALAAKIRDGHADAVFFGGLNVEGAGLLRKALGELGLDQVSFVGTGGSFVADASTFFGTIGPRAANTYSIVAGADPSTFTSGEQVKFTQQYSQFGIPEPFSAGGYDAANVVIKVIKGLIDAGKPVTKESVVEGVLSGTFTGGVTSNRIQFDQNGDNIGQRVFTIYQSEQPSQDTWNWKVFSTRQTG